MKCPEASAALGAYVLGALEPDERREVADHVRVCGSCAAELAEFAGLPALLARVGPEDLAPVRVTPSAELFDRVSAGAGTRRPRRSRTWALVAAAFLVALGAGIGAVVWATSTGDGAVTATQVTATEVPATEVPATEVTATAGPVEVTLTASQAFDGAAIDVTVAGMRPGETCTLVAIDRDGRSHPAGDWPTSAAGDGRWRGWADVEPGALAEVVVLGDGGREVVRVPL